MSGPTAQLVAAVCAAAAVALLGRGPADRRLRPRRHPGAARGPVAGRSDDRLRDDRRRGSLARRPGTARRRAAAELDAVVGLVDRLAALVRAGLPAVTAWQHLAGLPGPVQPACVLVAECVRSGGGAGAALHDAAGFAVARRAATAGGLAPAEVLGWLAVAVTVSERTGAPLADCLDRLAGTVRAELAAADERATALAGPHATAQVLGWLPAAGVLLGALVGADPLRTLVTTTPGRACAVAGIALWAAGRLWSTALVRAAGRADA